MSRAAKIYSDIKTLVIGVLKRFTNLILLFLVIILITSLVRNIMGLRKRDPRLEETRKKLEEIKKENENLEQELRRVQSEEYIEKQLRDKLGMAKEGDVVIIMPEPEVVRKFAPKIEEEEEVLPDPNWKKWIKLFF